MSRRMLDEQINEHGVQDAAAVRTAALADKKEWAATMGRVLWATVGDDDVVARMSNEEREDDIDESWSAAIKDAVGRAVKKDLKVAASTGESLHDPDRDSADELEVDNAEYDVLLTAVEDGFKQAYREAAE